MEPVDYLDVVTRIATNGDVYFGDEKLPGVIEAGSVKVTPGGASGDLNRLTATFYVGPVIVDDPSGEAS